MFLQDLSLSLPLSRAAMTVEGFRVLGSRVCDLGFRALGV